MADCNAKLPFTALVRLDADRRRICTVQHVATIAGLPGIFRPGFDIAQTRRELVGTVITRRRCVLAHVAHSFKQPQRGKKVTLGTILLIVLVLVLVGVVPTWPHSRSWGYGPSGVVGLIVLVLIILVLTGRL